MPSKEQLINSMHNLQVSHEKLCCEYWVIRAEGGYQAAEQLKEVMGMIEGKIKDIHASLMLEDAFESEDIDEV